MEENLSLLSSKRNQIKFMQWDITKRCNLRCKHCRSTDYYEGDKGEKIKDLTTEEVFNTLKELANNGVNRIHFLGGEPFMREDMLDIVKYASKLGIVCSINTNGTLITKEVIEKLFDSNVYLLTFSLDGASPETNDRIRGNGVFDLVCKNIKEVDRIRKERKQYLRIISSPVITKVNRYEAKALCYLAKDLGLDSIIITNLRKKGRAKENIEDLGLTVPEEVDVAEEIAEVISTGLKQHIQLGIGTPLLTEYLNKKYSINLPIIPGGCNALMMKGFIQPDGALFPCQEVTDFFYLNNERKNIIRTRILEHGFENIWNSKDYLNLFEKMFNIDMIKNNIPCNQCKYIYTYCYPCPLPILRGNGPIHHPTCIETLKRANRDNINLTDKDSFDVDLSTIVHKAVSDGNFRIKLFTDPEGTLKQSRLSLLAEEDLKLNKLIDGIEQDIDSELKNLIKGRCFNNGAL